MGKSQSSFLLINQQNLAQATSSSWEFLLHLASGIPQTPGQYWPLFLSLLSPGPLLCCRAPSLSPWAFNRLSSIPRGPHLNTALNTIYADDSETYISSQIALPNSRCTDPSAYSVMSKRHLQLNIPEAKPLISPKPALAITTPFLVDINSILGHATTVKLPLSLLFVFSLFCPTHPWFLCTLPLKYLQNSNPFSPPSLPTLWPKSPSSRLYCGNSLLTRLRASAMSSWFAVNTATRMFPMASQLRVNGKDLTVALCEHTPYCSAPPSLTPVHSTGLLAVSQTSHTPALDIVHRLLLTLLCLSPEICTSQFKYHLLGESFLVLPIWSCKPVPTLHISRALYPAPFFPKMLISYKHIREFTYYCLPTHT